MFCKDLQFSHLIKNILFLCIDVDICVRADVVPSPCLAAGQSGMDLSLTVVVRWSQWNEACCFIGQDKVLRQDFGWRSELCQSQMELHNRINPSGIHQVSQET